MKANAVVFTGPRQVEFTQIDVPDSGDGQFTIQTLVTLMSMGTELICYRGESDPGTHRTETPTNHIGRPLRFHGFHVNMIRPGGG